MFVEKNVYVVKRGMESAFESLLWEIRKLGMADDGVISMKLFRNLDNPLEYIAINEYRVEEDDLASHKNPKFQELRQELLKTLEKEPIRERYITVW